MKKNKLVLLLSIPTLAFSLALTNLNNDFKVAKAAGTYSGGTGTETDPYILSNKDDVASLRDNVNSGEHYADTYFEMSDNITLDANWLTPIGVDSTNYFAGNFDGGDYTLNFYDSTMIEISNDNYGLFGYTIGATIKNLVIAGDLQVKIKASNFGTLAGVIDSTTIENVTVEGYNSFADNYKIHFEKDAHDSNEAYGGIVGKVIKSSTITGSTSSVSIFSDNKVGGIAGEVDSSTIQDTIYTGLITPDLMGLISPQGDMVGGTIGHASYSTILRNVYKGNISGNTNVAGIVGYASNSTIAENCGYTFVMGIGTYSGISNDDSTCTYNYNYSVLKGAINGKDVANKGEYLAEADYKDIDALRMWDLANWTVTENTPAPLATHRVSDVESAINLLDDKSVVLGENFLKYLDNANAAYDGLSIAKKALVANYSVLEKANENAEDLKKRAALIKDAKEKIYAIGEVVLTDECKTLIETARAAYELVNVADKSQVYNYFALEDAEKEYARLETFYNAVNAAIDDINAIGEVVLTDECKALIDTARSTYDALETDEMKSAVTNYNELVSKENAYELLKKNKEEIDLVIAQIANIGPIVNTEECHNKILVARESYNALSETQQKQITNYGTLLFAERIYLNISSLENFDYGQVIIKIRNIGTVSYTEASLTLINDARESYDALSEGSKELVTNYNDLLKAESDYKVLGVVEQINNIGKVSNDEESKAKVLAAREAYDALSDEEKANVYNYTILENAEIVVNSPKEDLSAVEVTLIIIASTLFAALVTIGALLLIGIRKNRIKA